MIGPKTAIGIIPARGGSKGLVNKNILPMLGKPLIAWTIEKALKSQHLDAVMVSTDSAEIAEISEKFGATVPFLRPGWLATDTSTSYEVISHALGFYKESEKRIFDYTALLEPTSPLREDDDIDRVLTTLDEAAENFDSIVTLGKVIEHPSIVKQLVDREVRPFCKGLVQSSRRQDNVPAYFPYGVAYVAKTHVLLKENTFYTDRCMGFPIHRYQNFEIDDVYDFYCVENIMKREWALF